ncbi:BatD family protein [soil metagenome]
MSLRLTILVVLLAIGLPPSASAQNRVDASATPMQATADGRVVYTLRITGNVSEVEPVQLPDLLNLMPIQAAPRQQVSFHTQAGLTREQLVLEWDLRALRPGPANIGAANVVIGGRNYRTAPIRINVGPAAVPSGPPVASAPGGESRNRDMFIRAEVSPRTAYPGQQVTVDYVIYFNQFARPRSTRVLGSWNTPGFWREIIPLTSRDVTPRPVSIGGAPYSAATVKRVALFPTRRSDEPLEIGEVEFEVDVAITQRGSGLFDQFFNPFTARQRRERTIAPATSLQIRPLPDGAPATFSGAVGRFGMAVQYSEESVEVGGGLEARVILTGDGNLSILSAPTLTTSGGLDVLPPRSEQTLDTAQLPIRGRRSFTFPIIARDPGEQEVDTVEWTYFDLQDGAYRTLRAEVFPISVTGMPAAIAPTIAPATAEWRRVGDSPAVIPFWWMLIFLPLVALGAGLALWRWHQEDWQDPAPDARRRRARPLAERRLRTASAARANGNRELFHAQIERSLLAFLSDHLHTDLKGLDRAGLAARLRAHDVSEDIVTDVLDVLRQAEDARFGGPAENAAAVEAGARDIVRRLAPEVSLWTRMRLVGAKA